MTLAESSTWVEPGLVEKRGLEAEGRGQGGGGCRDSEAQGSP